VNELLERIARSQTKRPVAWLLAAVLLAVASLPFVAKLKLNSNWVAMLPETKESVRDLELTQKRVGGLNELSVLVQGSDQAQLIAFAKALVPRLEALEGKERVFAVEWNIAEYEDFVYSHRQLYAKLDDLREIRDELSARLDYERLKHNPLYVSLEDPPEEPQALIDRMQKKSEEGRQKLARYPEGFYVHPKGDLLALFVRTDIGGGDAESTSQLIATIEREVKALDPSKYGKDITVEYAGSLMAALEEHRAIREELTLSTVLTSIAVLLVVLLFFRKFRAPFLLGSGVAIPTLITFAFARLTVEELNTSTAFLGSIVLGNGVNTHVIWLARYFEERRNGVLPERALLATHIGTFRSTLAAQSTAALSYGSLILTDFRGFRDFGIIASAGMLICWFSAYTILPPATALSERARPLRFAPRTKTGTIYGRIFWALAEGAPRTMVIISILATIVSTAFVYHAVVNDPIEYDFRKLKSVREESSRISLLNKRVNELMPAGGEGNAVALLVPKREDTAPLVAELIERRDKQGAPYGAVRSIDDLLPADQLPKLPVLAEIRQLLLDARQYADDEEIKKIDEHVPPADIKVLGDADLPESVARRFTERDGTRGRIIFVINQKQLPNGKKGPSVWDGRYLIAWSDALRNLRLPDGTRPPLAGRAPVFADMVEAVLEDGPIAVFASLGMTIALLSIAFRRMRERLASLGSLMLGVLWMAGTMAASGMKLNFLNFVAFPITFGNGADYSVNVMQRFVQEQQEPTASDGAVSSPEPARPGETRMQRAIRIAVQESGGAVILCSMTTVIGYTSLHVSGNKALNSFGAAMAISEITCLLNAVVMLPAILWLLGRKKDSPSTPA
jgi:predicted RND superfamily exporter protein